MTMILNSPDALMNISMHHQQNELALPADNILDELNEEEDGAHSNRGGSMPNFNANNSLINGNTSLLNASSLKGLNTTMNFIKSTYFLT